MPASAFAAVYLVGAIMARDWYCPGTSTAWG
jgi:hypothetical protein